MQMKTMLPNLQILRFLAAAMVLLSHVQHQAGNMRFVGADYVPWNGIYLAGGVDIFFVISGFIMYSISSGDFGRAGAAGKFFTRRLVRIVPPYWLFTAAMVVAAFIFSDHIQHPLMSLDHILASLVFLPYANPYGKPYPMLMLGWTLNYEFFFYVVFALALLFSRRAGLLFVAVAIGGLAVLGLFDTFARLPMSFWSNPIMLEFLLGIGLAMAREKGARCSTAASVALIAAGFAAMFALMQMGIANHHWAVRFLWMGLPALAICAGAVLPEQPPHATGIGKPLVFLGDASYALYLSHPFALNLVAVFWKRSGLGDPYLYVALSCVFSLLVGCATHVLIEKPMTRYLNRRLTQRQGGQIRRQAAIRQDQHEAP